MATPLPRDIQCDPKRLRQIVTNLTGNALKFTEKGGVRVVLSIKNIAGHKRYAIDIIDSGIGIPHDKLHLLGNGPQRVGVLASMLGVGPKVLQKTVEPYLLRAGMVVKNDAGLRTLTESGHRHLEDMRPASVRNQTE